MIVSFFVYLFVNLFENMFHYNIGKFSNREIDFTKNLIPTNRDWSKIVIVMVIFAGIQGVFRTLLEYLLQGISEHLDGR